MCPSCDAPLTYQYLRARVDGAEARDRLTVILAAVCCHRMPKTGANAHPFDVRRVLNKLFDFLAPRATIDAHRKTYGVEPICRVLPIAGSTYSGTRRAAEKAWFRLAMRAVRLRRIF